MCKEGAVKVEITVYDRVKEETIYFENGRNVLRLEDKILSQYGKEIRSWNDLFTIRETDADKATGLNQKSLDPQYRKI